MAPDSIRRARPCGIGLCTARLDVPLCHSGLPRWSHHGSDASPRRRRPRTTWRASARSAIPTSTTRPARSRTGCGSTPGGSSASRTARKVDSAATSIGSTTASPPDGSRQAGAPGTRAAEQRSAGLDMTFSADKSVSVALGRRRSRAPLSGSRTWRTTTPPAWPWKRRCCVTAPIRGSVTGEGWIKVPCRGGRYPGGRHVRQHGTSRENDPQLHVPTA